MATYITNHQLLCYTVFFSGHTIFTTVTADSTTVSNWISDIKSIFPYKRCNLTVGLDVEWRPSFTRGIQKPVATVQICVGRRCLIYQIIHIDCIPQSLVSVGVGVQSDLDKLVAQYGIGRNARAVDLRMLAADAYDRDELKREGMKGLASLVLGKEMEKPQWVSRSAWDNPKLTDAQVQYACIDAFVSFEIGRVLHAPNYYNQLNFGKLSIS